MKNYLLLLTLLNYSKIISSNLPLKYIYTKNQITNNTNNLFDLHTIHKNHKIFIITKKNHDLTEEQKIQIEILYILDCKTKNILESLLDKPKYQSINFSWHSITLEDNSVKLHYFALHNNIQNLSKQNTQHIRQLLKNEMIKKSLEELNGVNMFYVLSYFHSLNGFNTYCEQCK